MSAPELNPAVEALQAALVNVELDIEDADREIDKAQAALEAQEARLDTWTRKRLTLGNKSDAIKDAIMALSE